MILPKIVNEAAVMNEGARRMVVDLEVGSVNLGLAASDEHSYCMRKGVKPLEVMDSKRPIHPVVSNNVQKTIVGIMNQVRYRIAWPICNTAMICMRDSKLNRYVLLT